MSANFSPVFFLITYCTHIAITSDQISCAYVVHTSPKTSVIFHSRSGVPFITGLVDSKCSVYGFGQKVQFSSHHSKWLCAWRFEARLCAVWHFVSGTLCGICCLLCILKQPHHIFSESPEVICTFFLASPTVFLAVVAEILVGLRDCGLVSTEPPIFHFLIRVWTMLIFSYIRFLFYKVQLPFPADLLTILLLSPWLRITSVNERCMGLSGAQKVTDLLYTPTDYEQTHHRWRWWHFIAFLTFLCQVVCKSPGYVNFWSGSFG